MDSSPNLPDGLVIPITSLCVASARAVTANLAGVQHHRHVRAVKIVYRSNFEDAKPYEREFKGIQKFEPISRSHPAS